MNNCGKDKIRNPETGRCVLKTGAIGKKILKKKKESNKKESNKKESNKKEPKKKEEKPCDKDKIRNPETGRCVLKTGAIGKKILAKNSPKKSNNSFKTPPKDFKSKGYLLINNKKINKISGPVKIIILKPKIDFYKKYKLPLFILFGDIHDSNRNMCKD